MRLDDPIWLLLGGAFIVTERANRVREELTRRSRAATSRYLNNLIDRVAGSDPVSRFVDIQLARNLEPLLDKAVPMVIDRLGEQTDQIRLIVREHGEDLTGELVAGIRDRTAAADDIVENGARRLVGRRGTRS